MPSRQSRGEPSSLLPPHAIPLGRPSAPAPSRLSIQELTELVIWLQNFTSEFSTYLKPLKITMVKFHRFWRKGDFILAQREK